MDQEYDNDAVFFSDFELRRDPLRLLRAGEDVQLRRQALQLLELLVSHPKELVRHDAIRDALWSERVVDHVRGTHLLIREIRQALEDDAGQPRFIETVPRYGYRFVAELAEVSDEPPATGSRKNPARRYGVIAAAVIGIILAIGFVVGNRIPVESDRSSVSDAQAAFEKGEYLRHRRGTDNLTPETEDEVGMSIAYFETAIRLDPEFAAAHASLAAIYDLQGEYGLAETHAQQAIAIDPDRGDAHATLALLAMNRDWDWQRAEASLQRALLLEPGSVRALSAKARLMIILARRDEAKNAAQQALALDPVTAALQIDNGWYHYYVGDYEAGLRICTEATQLNPDYWFGYECQLRAAVMLGDATAASLAAAGIADTWDEIPDLVARLRENPGAASLESFFAYRRARIERLRERPTFCPDRGAAAMAEMGDYEVAASMIDDAARSPVYRLPYALRDPVFSPLHNDPRYQSAVRITGIPDSAGNMDTALSRRRHEQVTYHCNGLSSFSAKADNLTRLRTL